MALFVLTGFDHKGAQDRRAAARPDHLAFIDNHRAMVKLAGPVLDQDGQPIGSMFIIEAETEAAVEAFSDADPYRVAGVFERVEIHGFRVVVGALA